MNTGDRIKARRIELGLTQEELANKMGNKSRASVWTVEKNRDDLTTSRLMAYARALDCSPSYLMGWEDPDDLNNDIETVDYVCFEEKTVIEAYRAADDPIKTAVCKLLDIKRDLPSSKDRKEA